MLYKRELINSFETIGYSCGIMMSIVIGPKWSFYLDQVCFSYLEPPCLRESLAHTTSDCPGQDPSFSCLGTCAKVSFIPWHMT